MIKLLIAGFLSLMLVGCGTAIEIQVVNRSTGQPVTAGAVNFAHYFSFTLCDLSGTLDEQGIASMNVDLEEMRRYPMGVIAPGFSPEEHGPEWKTSWKAFLDALAHPTTPKPPNRWVEYVVPIAP
ncbi:MAG: hypothetical protein AABZ53_00980 [Planctomycetota bacterium]